MISNAMYSKTKTTQFKQQNPQKNMLNRLQNGSETPLKWPILLKVSIFFINQKNIKNQTFEC